MTLYEPAVPHKSYKSSKTQRLRVIEGLKSHSGTLKMSVSVIEGFKYTAFPISTPGSGQNRALRGVSVIDGCPL